MKIISLVENTTNNPKLRTKHGLCLYIETDRHRILFDVGQNELFLENAKKLGIDIKMIDTVIISHGHADHGGGLSTFMSVNEKAKLYIRKDAFDKHYTKVFGLRIPVGIDASIKDLERVIITDDFCRIDDELELFSFVTERKLFSKANNKLLMKKNGRISRDDFLHEQYLVIKGSGGNIMITGCSHNGIVNIMERYDFLYRDFGGKLKMVVGGFHLFNPGNRKYENKELIIGVAEFLNRFDISYYTCHCTGRKAFDVMKDILKDKLSYLATGDEIDYE